MLYLVGTPIGNLDDMSPRACEVLKNVDVIACEDTRVTGILLSNLGITGKRLIAYHEHNKAASGNGIIDLLKQGLDVAVTPARIWLFWHHRMILRYRLFRVLQLLRLHSAFPDSIQDISISRGSFLRRARKGATA